LSVGLILFGVGFYRARGWGDYSILPLLTGVVWAAWFPFVLADQAWGTRIAEWAQLTFGGLWIAMGGILLLQARAVPQRGIGDEGKGSVQ
jgi:hypothetical protein